MIVTADLGALRRQLGQARKSGRAIHFVPTMGNLHAGHLALVVRARAGGALAVVSVFVNPTQFAPGEDYARYPRTLDADLSALQAHGCELVWTPAVATVYPLGPEDGFRVAVPGALADCLCGASRPGHFDGVAGVVLRLFHQVGADAAFFGEKDFQQLLIIRRMAADLSMPVEIVGVPTVRDPRGLALSSRNRYLSAAELEIAPELHAALSEIACQLVAGKGTYDQLERSAVARLEGLGFRPDYVRIRSGLDLGPPDGRADRVFAAAWLGSARLIDNVEV